MRRFGPVLLITIFSVAVLLSSSFYVYAERAERITVEKGEEKRVINKNVIAEAAWNNGGLLVVENSEISCEYKEGRYGSFNLYEGTTYVNNSVIMDAKIFAHYDDGYHNDEAFTFISTSSFQNIKTINIIDRYDQTIHADNTSFSDIERLQITGKFIPLDCTFTNVQEWSGYVESISTVEVIISNEGKIVPIEYELFRDGKKIYEGARRFKSLINFTHNYSNFQYHDYKIHLQYHGNNYSKVFTATPNKVVEIHLQNDTDRDGIFDTEDPDIDGDGWKNHEEEDFSTDPYDNQSFPSDLDGDHIPDEIDEDIDGDGWNNSIEERAGSDPLDNASAPSDLDGDGEIDLLDDDIDGDGFDNEFEDLAGTNKTDNSSFPVDTDKDGLYDFEDEDVDGDRWNNSIEINLSTDPKDASSFPADTDGDGIPDVLDEDIDGDTWNNTIENKTGTDPYDNRSFPADLDGDGVPDDLDNDIDGDGWNNTKDLFPFNGSAWERPEDVNETVNGTEGNDTEIPGAGNENETEDGGEHEGNNTPSNNNLEDPQSSNQGGGSSGRGKELLFIGGVLLIVFVLILIIARIDYEAQGKEGEREEEEGEIEIEIAGVHKGFGRYNPLPKPGAFPIEQDVYLPEPPKREPKINLPVQEDTREEDRLFLPPPPPAVQKTIPIVEDQPGPQPIEPPPEPPEVMLPEDVKPKQKKG